MESSGRTVTAQAVYGSSGCVECGAAEIDAELKSAFGVCVCNRCKKQGADYKVLSRTASKEAFLLSDSDFTMLKFLTKPNPRNAKWKPLQLYLQRQLRALAYAKYGNLEGLEAERAKRAAKRAERQELQRGTKRQHMSDLATGGGDAGEWLELSTGVSVPIAAMNKQHTAGSSKRPRPTVAPPSHGVQGGGASVVAAALGISFQPPASEQLGYRSAARTHTRTAFQAPSSTHAASKPGAARARRQRQPKASDTRQAPAVVGGDDDFEEL